MALPLKLSVLAAIMLLGACRSDPISFHTLTPVHQGAGVSGADIAIESISVPPQVDRPQIVIREGNSGLAILETDWWGASLIDELRSALLDQLSNGAGQQRSSVRVDVQRFDSIPGQYALIDVKWRLRALGAPDAELLSCRSILQTPSGPSIEELVTAQQNNVKRLAAQITQAASSSRGCPAAG
ncbi:membrane integrity-associated transporter subunit PqiC [Pseudomonas granadensis]|uniref:Membrane integrity-associated transporter subunit PqiC n=1 Tax=Pseudomonas granadensis TaxID=1421430 RepID=A0ABX7G9Q7_9PSED|nr:PqiC family protein [Pseudomonas granadensis]MBN6774179.1 membrane integrity-associated transporter subunit PqiC [Pseudomonas granadensis]MBN6805347.1 membrane integrity-associated transporter subunit PqiC [Pseudomonas granadensis]MBN6832205.1 membrane integrity-associated transporter subunit PqiC [Pseudomonas granadensis]MBN6839541.1 membrane integrity-associated transporter subunit PqiC [Pseudomonas granadensis]MBN6868628.1 membrane integrity-associated transporter subunit PqiC [Pseudomon